MRISQSGRWACPRQAGLHKTWMTSHLGRGQAHLPDLQISETCLAPPGEDSGSAITQLPFECGLQCGPQFFYGQITCRKDNDPVRLGLPARFNRAKKFLGWTESGRKIAAQLK